MRINRREFLMLTTAVVVTGCSSTENVGVPSTGGERVVNAGPVNNYTADGVYAAFRSQGFFIIRLGEKLFALSAICTHKKCKLNQTVPFTVHATAPRLIPTATSPKAQPAAICRSSQLP